MSDTILVRHWIIIYKTLFRWHYISVSSHDNDTNSSDDDDNSSDICKTLHRQTMMTLDVTLYLSDTLHHQTTTTTLHGWHCQTHCIIRRWWHLMWHCCLLVRHTVSPVALYEWHYMFSRSVFIPEVNTYGVHIFKCLVKQLWNCINSRLKHEHSFQSLPFDNSQSYLFLFLSSRFSSKYIWWNVETNVVQESSLYL